MPTRSDVRETYDEIATDFSHSRDSAWPEVSSFLAERSGGIGLDLGCGNGRHAAHLANCTDRVLGVDASRNLLDEARMRATALDYDVTLVQGDASRIPISDHTVELAVYIATIHHLPSHEARLGTLNELARVLTADGVALVSSWSTAADRFDDPPSTESEQTTGFDTTVDWTLPEGTVVDRYYHIFYPAGFRRLLEASELGVESHTLSHGNCYAVVCSDP